MNATADPGPADPPSVEIVRSRKRKRTMSAYRDGDRTVVMLPAGLNAVEEQRAVDDMLGRLARKEARARIGDGELGRRAAALSVDYLDGRARPASVRWVTNQNSRWGSCTPQERTIRLSHRLQSMPSWVVDYVLVHELAHLLVHSHGPEFWRLVERYPRTERARGYLEGVAATAGLRLAGHDADDVGDLDDVDDGPAA
jgi:predicted metal-dependent hydrolase